MVELKVAMRLRGVSPRRANEQLLSAVLDDVDLLTLILSKVNKWSDEWPCLALGRSRQVCKQWNELGLHKLVREAYCEAMNWDAMPRWCSSQHRLPKCGNAACSYVNRNTYWEDFRAFCPSCNITTILPPKPPEPLPPLPDGMLTWQIRKVMQTAEEEKAYRTTWQVAQFIKQEHPFDANKFEFVEVMGGKRVSGCSLRRPLWVPLVRLSKHLNPGETYVVSSRFRLHNCDCSASRLIHDLDKEDEIEFSKRQVQLCVACGKCEWTPWSGFSEEVTVLAPPEEMD